MICEGRLVDSDSVNLGSNPSSPAIDLAGLFRVLHQNITDHLGVHLGVFVLLSSFRMALSASAGSRCR
jgi:hypothetical protein